MIMQYGHDVISDSKKTGVTSQARSHRWNLNCLKDLSQCSSLASIYALACIHVIHPVIRTHARTHTHAVSSVLEGTCLQP